MKYKKSISPKVLKAFADMLLETEGPIISLDVAFLNSFSGTKRVKKKRAKRMALRIIKEILVPSTALFTKEGKD